MEKGTAHYRLAWVRELIAQKRVRLTTTAAIGAQSMNICQSEAIEVVARLQSTDFYKSMTSYDDHRVWQDVYRPVTPYGRVYLKLTVIEEVLVVSFKAR